MKIESRWLAILLCAAIAPAIADEKPTPAANPLPTEKPDANGTTKRLREGSEISDVTGVFRVSGDRVSFFPANGPELRVLENLALERVLRVLNETREQRTWVVSGRMTEFRGANFLFLTRAATKSK